MEPGRKPGPFSMKHDPAISRDAQAQVLDERYRVVLSGRTRTLDGVTESIGKITNAVDAFLVGGPGHVHPGRRMPLEEAVEACLGRMNGALVLLDEGAAAYFEPEMGEEARCVLTRDTKALQTLRGR